MNGSATRLRDVSNGHSWAGACAQQPIGERSNLALCRAADNQAETPRRIGASSPVDSDSEARPGQVP
jgi:hypothetical protein